MDELEKFRDGDPELLKEIIRHMRCEFIAYVHYHFNCPRCEAEDFFFSAYLCLLVNAKRGGLRPGSSIKTKLFTAGIHLLLNDKKYANRKYRYCKFMDYSGAYYVTNEIEKQFEDEDNKARVEEFLGACTLTQSGILIDEYYNENDIATIASLHHLPGKNAVEQHKSKGIRRIRKKFGIVKKKRKKKK